MSTDWFKSFNDVAGYAKNAAQQATTMLAGSELEKKLAEATSNEPWGASSQSAPWPAQDPARGELRARARLEDDRRPAPGRLPISQPLKR